MLARDLNSCVIEINNEHGGSFYDLACIHGSKTNILCGSPRSKLIWLSARSSHPCRTMIVFSFMVLLVTLTLL